jgi:hypothetical protein
MRTLCRDVLRLAPMVEEDGWTLFQTPNGTIRDLSEQDSK